MRVRSATDYSRAYPATRCFEPPVESTTMRDIRFRTSGQGRGYPVELGDWKCQNGPETYRVYLRLAHLSKGSNSNVDFQLAARISLKCENWLV